MTTDTILNLFRGTNLNSTYAKAVVLPCACTLVSWLHGLVLASIQTSFPFRWRTVIILPSHLEESLAARRMTITITEDYQPQGTDFRVEYLYCGFRTTLVLRTRLPSLLHFSSPTYFNHNFFSINAKVSGMCSLLPSYWLSPLLLGSNYPGPTAYLGPPSHHYVLKQRKYLVLYRSYDRSCDFPERPHAIAMSEARFNAMTH
jgi:hypothetical protein